MDKILFQIWVRKLVIHILRAHSNLLSHAENDFDFDEKLSITDQNVLYYISGFMSMKLKEVSRKFTKLRNRDAVIDCLSTNEFKESGHFVYQYKSWWQNKIESVYYFQSRVSSC